MQATDRPSLQLPTRPTDRLQKIKAAHAKISADPVRVRLRGPSLRVENGPTREQAGRAEAGGEASLRGRVEGSLLPHATSLLHRSEKAFRTNGTGSLTRAGAEKGGRFPFRVNERKQ